MSEKPTAGIFIVPRASTAWRGNEAGWITTSGWASAGEALWGNALVATTDGVFSPEESRLFPRGSRLVQGSRLGGTRRFIPEVAITAVKDFQLWRSKPSQWPIENEMILNSHTIKLVWERHDLFAGPGRRLASRLGVPLVINVEAPSVWEAKRWGVHRPIWGNLMEKYSEARSLASADLVSCVSEEVMEQVVRMGVPASRVVVSHNRVDASLFHPGVTGDRIRNEFGTSKHFVFGWIGSFRSFHGIDHVVSAFATFCKQFPSSMLVMVGDGQELERTRAQAQELGIQNQVLFPGRKPFTEMPSVIASFNVAITSARTSEGFHYSPLKLREYLACGIPAIAPAAGNLPELFTDEKDVVFYQPGDVQGLAGKMKRLLTDESLIARLSQQAVATATTQTWTHELKQVCTRLGVTF